MHSKVISIPSAKFEPPPVHKMMTNNIKPRHKEKQNPVTKLSAEFEEFVFCDSH